MPGVSSRTIRIASAGRLELHHARASLVDYRGRRAIKVTEAAGRSGEVEAMAVLPGLDFGDGVIETAIAGLPRSGAPEFARGFVGIAFRVQPGASRFEVFFLRPTNSRSEDQLRRNHTAQYMSPPDHPWFRLREESPGRYESYVDMMPGAWTPIRIAVNGAYASLWVNHASQPCLIVNDLKLGDTDGRIGLWIGSETEAYFSGKLVIRRAD